LGKSYCFEKRFLQFKSHDILAVFSTMPWLMNQKKFKQQSKTPAKSNLTLPRALIPFD